MRNTWQFVETVLKIIFRHPVPGTSVIPILPSGEIVLVRRRDTGKWSLPGGMVEWGEDIATTVRRELLEETGLELLESPRLIGVYSSLKRDPRIHSIAVLVEAKVRGTLKIGDTLEISEIEAFAREDLPLGKLSHDHDEQLKNYLEGSITLN